jgi:HlyD family secretion protein
MKRWLALPVLLWSGMVAAQPLELEGEIIALRTAPIMPPVLQDVWQLNIAEFASEGSQVKGGDVIVRFEVGDLTKRLLENQNKLSEKTREHAQLLLALAERERNETLATAQARADLEKAQRKAEQPEDAIRSLDYKKLVVERSRAERRLVLSERREQLARKQRRAEQNLLETEIKWLQSEAARLKASIAALSVKAPLSGMMLYRSNFQGEKFAVGSQVWAGMTIAEIPNTNTLAVRAVLPERDLLRVAEGDSAKVRIDAGAASSLTARVVRLGKAVHSKSRVQPIPVIDVMLEFDRRASGLRPGQQVRVEIQPRDRKAILTKAGP